MFRRTDGRKQTKLKINMKEFSDHVQTLIESQGHIQLQIITSTGTNRVQLDSLTIKITSTGTNTAELLCKSANCTN